MKITTPSVKLLWHTPQALQIIEQAGRVCYKSEGKIGPYSAAPFVKMLKKKNHGAMLEHASMSWLVVCDRGVSHALVRHRLFSYAQESTQYCNYGGKPMEFIRPAGLPVSGAAEKIWMDSCSMAERHYNQLIDLGYKPETARYVLPTCLKTELVITGNMREWLYVFQLRLGDFRDQSQIRHVVQLLQDGAIELYPEIFGPETDNG